MAAVTVGQECRNFRIVSSSSRRTSRERVESWPSSFSRTSHFSSAWRASSLTAGSAFGSSAISARIHRAPALWRTSQAGAKKPDQAPGRSLITWTRHPASGCTSLSIPRGSIPGVRARRASLALVPQLPRQNKSSTGAHVHREPAQASPILSPGFESSIGHPLQLVEPFSKIRHGCALLTRARAHGHAAAFPA